MVVRVCVLDSQPVCEGVDLEAITKQSFRIGGPSGPSLDCAITILEIDASYIQIWTAGDEDVKSDFSFAPGKYCLASPDFSSSPVWECGMIKLDCRPA